MLTALRNNRKSISGLLIAGFVAILMVGFGVNLTGKRGGFNRAPQEAAIKIAGKEISYETFDKRLYQVSEMARYQLGENYSKMKAFLNLEQRTVDEIINSYLIKDFVKKLGLSASNPQVERYIQNLPFFQKNGFNQQTYSLFLSSQGISGLALEQETREALANKQLIDFLTNVNTPSNEELKAIYLAKNAKFEFSYVGFKASKFEANVDTKDEAKLQQYYDLNKANYEKPRTVKYSYIKFSPEQFQDKVEVNEDELQTNYQESLASYYEPKEFNLKRIIVNKAKDEKNPLEEMVSPDTAKNGEKSLDSKNELIKDSVKKIVTRLKNNEKFDALAKELSEDKDTAKNGGSLGWVKANTLDKDIRVIAERMEKGKFSDVIETTEYFAIIMIEDLKEKRLKPFSEVRAALETQRRAEDAPEYAKAEADNFLRKYQEQDSATKLSFEEFAKKENLKPQILAKPMNASENPSDALGLTAKVITLSTGSTQVVKLPDSLYAVEVNETKNSYIPEFTAVKEEIVKDYVKDKSQGLAKDAAEKFLTEATNKDAKSIEQLASYNSLEIKNTAGVKRGESPQNEPLFANPDTLKMVFNLTTDNPYPKTIAQGSHEYFVLRLKNKIIPDEKEIAGKIKEALKEENTASGNRFVNYILHVLKLENETWVNPKILETTKSSGADYEV